MTAQIGDRFIFRAIIIQLLQSVRLLSLTQFSLELLP